MQRPTSHADFAAIVDYLRWWPLRDQPVHDTRDKHARRPERTYAQISAGMETAAMRCAASTQRCVTSRLQTKTKARDGVRVRACSCVLVE